MSMPPRLKFTNNLTVRRSFVKYPSYYSSMRSMSHGRLFRGACVKFFATALAAVYFSVNGVFSHAVESNFWSERRRAVLPSGEASSGMPEMLREVTLPETALRSLSIPNPVVSGVDSGRDKILAALPLSLGTVRRAPPSGPGSGKTVIHILDVHKNDDAQRNIGKAVQSLIDAGVPGLVALEGASSPIELARFRAFPDREAVRQAADYLLREHKISGPVHAAMIHPASVSFPPFIGIDDAGHYAANVEAFRRSAPLMAEMKARLDADRAVLDRKKKVVFNPELLAFDEAAGSYHEGKMPLGDFVETLAGRPPSDNLPEGVRIFLQAHQMEKEMDLREVEKERTRLVEKLSRTLPRDRIERLVQKGMAYRLGEITCGDFHRFLRDICRESGVSLSEFPRMGAYIRYVLLAERVPAGTFLDDLSRLETDRYARLTTRPEEKALAAESRRLGLARKLADFSLTSEEWKEYDSLSGDRPFPSPSFEAFYREALARDEAMAGNVLKSMAERGTDKAVLVTGGFHADGISKVLSRAGVKVITFVPRIEKDEGSGYLSDFAREKTPMERLFVGEKLFLAAPPAEGAGEARALVGAEIVFRDWGTQDLGVLNQFCPKFQRVVNMLKERGVQSPPLTVFSVAPVLLDKERLAVSVELGPQGHGRALDMTVICDKKGRIEEVVSGFSPSLSRRARLRKALRAVLVPVIGALNQRWPALTPIIELPLFLFLPVFGPWYRAWIIGLHSNESLEQVILRAWGLEWIAAAQAASGKGFFRIHRRVLAGISAHRIFNRVFPEAPLAIDAEEFQRALLGKEVVTWSGPATVIHVEPAGRGSAFKITLQLPAGGMMTREGQADFLIRRYDPQMRERVMEEVLAEESSTPSIDIYDPAGRLRDLPREMFSLERKLGVVAVGEKDGGANAVFSMLVGGRIPPESDGKVWVRKFGSPPAKEEDQKTCFFVIENAENLDAPRGVDGSLFMSDVKYVLVPFRGVKDYLRQRIAAAAEKGLLDKGDAWKLSRMIWTYGEYMARSREGEDRPAQEESPTSARYEVELGDQGSGAFFSAVLFYLMAKLLKKGKINLEVERSDGSPYEKGPSVDNRSSLKEVFHLRKSGKFTPAAVNVDGPPDVGHDLKTIANLVGNSLWTRAPGTLSRSVRGTLSRLLEQLPVSLVTRVAKHVPSLFLEGDAAWKDFLAEIGAEDLPEDKRREIERWVEAMPEEIAEAKPQTEEPGPPRKRKKRSTPSPSITVPVPTPAPAPEEPSDGTADVVGEEPPSSPPEGIVKEFPSDMMGQIRFIREIPRAEFPLMDKIDFLLWASSPGNRQCLVAPSLTAASLEAVAMQPESAGRRWDIQRTLWNAAKILRNREMNGEAGELERRAKSIALVPPASAGRGGGFTAASFWYFVQRLKGESLAVAARKGLSRTALLSEIGSLLLISAPSMPFRPYFGPFLAVFALFHLFSVVWLARRDRTPFARVVFTAVVSLAAVFMPYWAISGLSWAYWAPLGLLAGTWHFTWDRSLRPESPKEAARKLADDLLTLSRGGRVAPDVHLRLILARVFPVVDHRLDQRISSDSEAEIRVNRAFRARLEERFGRVPSSSELLWGLARVLRDYRSMEDLPLTLGRLESRGVAVVATPRMGDLGALVSMIRARVSSETPVFWAAADAETGAGLQRFLGASGTVYYVQNALTRLPSGSRGLDFKALAGAMPPAYAGIRSWGLVLPDDIFPLTDPAHLPEGNPFENAVLLSIRLVLGAMKARVSTIRELQEDYALARRLASFA